VVHELRRSGFDPDWLRVETAAALSAALTFRTWDVIIADHNLPGFNAPAALALVRQAGLDVPFLIVSGSIGEELAVGLMKQGAADYLFKDRLGRLGGAVEHALQERRLHEEKRQADQRLQDTARRLRAIFEHSSDGLSLLDASGTVVFASPSVTPILGYALEEFLGRNAFDMVHPEDLPDLRGQFAAERSGPRLPCRGRGRRPPPSWPQPAAGRGRRCPGRRSRSAAGRRRCGPPTCPGGRRSPTGGSSPASPRPWR
jgi:PAS domain-containing protein